MDSNAVAIKAGEWQAAHCTTEDCAAGDHDCQAKQRPEGHVLEVHRAAAIQHTVRQTATGTL